MARPTGAAARMRTRRCVRCGGGGSRRVAPRQMPRAGWHRAASVALRVRGRGQLGRRQHERDARDARGDRDGDRCEDAAPGSERAQQHRGQCEAAGDPAANGGGQAEAGAVERPVVARAARAPSPRGRRRVAVAVNARRSELGSSPTSSSQRARDVAAVHLGRRRRRDRSRARRSTARRPPSAGVSRRRRRWWSIALFRAMPPTCAQAASSVSRSSRGDTSSA